MMGHNICFYAELTKIISNTCIIKYSFLSRSIKVCRSLCAVPVSFDGDGRVCPNLQEDIIGRKYRVN